MQRCLLALLIFIPGLVSATELDTLQVKKGELLILDDTIFAPKSDTQIVINNRPYKLKGNPYRNSENFYSKMKEVTGQNKVTSRLFDLLYVEKGSTNEYKDDPDSRSSIEPFIPFENLVGKAQYIFFSLENSRFFQIWKWPNSIRYNRIFEKIK